MTHFQGRERQLKDGRWVPVAEPKLIGMMVGFAEGTYEFEQDFGVMAQSEIEGCWQYIYAAYLARKVVDR